VWRLEVRQVRAREFSQLLCTWRGPTFQYHERMRRFAPAFMWQSDNCYFLD
jgi:hypothetical protein